MSERNAGDFSARGYGHRYDPRYWSREPAWRPEDDFAPERQASRYEFDEWGLPPQRAYDATENWSAYIGAGSSLKDRQGDNKKQQSHAGKGPKNYKRSDDRITDEVVEVLTRSPDIDATDIEVSTTDGVLSLSGRVGSRRARRIAESLAEQVFGVKDVHNLLNVT